MVSESPRGTDLPAYQQGDFAGAKPPCDLIMKGGITSGVVYPLAITELATRYRFVSIGGTSAGAIAASVAAAAEYGRDDGGFIRVAGIPGDVSRRLLSLFQPLPRYRSVFKTFLAVLGNRSGSRKALSLIVAAMRYNWFAALAGLVPGAVLIAHAGGHRVGLAVWLIAVFVSLLGPILAVAVTAGLALYRGLPRTQFGICPGLQQPDEKEPGLTDWLAVTLERVAGRLGENGSLPDRPLTFGDLAERGIDLNVMTTNLSMRRPYRMPAEMSQFFWTREDFAKLFPGWVLRHLESVSAAEFMDGRPDALRFPIPEDLPVIVAVRMSLSFPVLLAAVPLYTRDFTYRLSKSEQQKARVCWFSDGGISSNFPIHFFDNLWPSHPTFAITLDEHHPARQGPQDDIDSRVHMPRKAGSGVLIPVSDIQGLVSFVGSIVSAAKDWQDVMQSTLSGYRERIAHVALTSDEGGLNLTMPEERVRLLSRFGYLAGKEMHAFDFDEHRWRRYLVALARIEETLHKLSTHYQISYHDFLVNYANRAESYEQPPGWIEEALRNTDALMEIAASTVENPLRARGNIPKPDTDVRISPRE